jgi:hypothetical protein
LSRYQLCFRSGPTHRNELDPITKLIGRAGQVKNEPSGLDAKQVMSNTLDLSRGDIDREDIDMAGFDLQQCTPMIEKLRPPSIQHDADGRPIG